MASAVSVHLSGDQSLTGGVGTVVELDTELYDVDGEFDTSTYKFTATVSGKYLVNYQATFDPTAAADQCILIIERGVVNVIEAVQSAHDGNHLRIGGSKVLALTAGQTLRMKAENVDNNDELQGGDEETFMTITRIQ